MTVFLQKRGDRELDSPNGKPEVMLLVTVDWPGPRIFPETNLPVRISRLG